MVLAPFDPAVGATPLAGVGTDPTIPNYLGTGLAFPITGDSPWQAAVRHRRGAVANPAARSATAQPSPAPTAEVESSARRRPRDADRIGQRHALRSAKPRPLKALIAQATGAAPVDEDQPDLPTDFRGRFDDDVVTTIGTEVRRLAGLTEALTTDIRTGLTGPQYTAPLREDMLRALSQIEPPDSRNEIARQRLPVVGRTIEELFHAVSIVNPGGTYTGDRAQRTPACSAQRFGGSDPGPATSRCSTRHDGHRSRRPGVTPGLSSLRVPVELHVSQRVAVDVTLRTPEGLRLGDPVRLSVHSNAYGKVLFALTLGGGLVLAFLVGRRLYHRFRGQPDRADLDRPWPPIISAESAERPEPTKSGSTKSGAEGTVTQSPQTRPQRPELSDSAVVSRSWGMALATLVSRITGFIRIVLLAAILGAALSSAFSVANQLPNMIAALVLEATFTAIFVPVLARAERDDSDGGAAFVRRLVTLATTLLLAVTVLAVTCAPQLVRLMLGADPQVNAPLTTAFAFLLLPQVIFYGLSSVFMAILNTRNVFGPPAWAPVLNNVVAIAALGLYLIVPGELSVDPVQMGNAKLLVLGIGTTFGVAAQAAVLLVAIRSHRISLRPLWGIDDRLKRFGTMALAMVLYVLISQIGFVVGNQIASTAAASGPAIYNYTWMVLMLPFGMIGVTILTVVMPRLSRNAAAEDNTAVLADFSLATRLQLVTLIPVVAFMTVAGPAIGSALFAYGNFGQVDANYLGMAIALSSFTLIPTRWCCCNCGSSTHANNRGPQS